MDIHLQRIQHLKLNDPNDYLSHIMHIKAWLGDLRNKSDFQLFEMDFLCFY